MQGMGRGYVIGNNTEGFKIMAFNKIYTPQDINLNRQFDEMISKQCKVNETKTSSVADATNAATAITQLNALLAQCRLAGLIPG